MFHRDNSYEFFLSELFLNDDGEELGYIIELMRVINHIKEIDRLLHLLSTPDHLDEDEAAYFDIEVDSARVFLFNITAAQLREALKLFYDFTQVKIYKDFKEEATPRQMSIISELEEYVNEYKHKKGLLYETLKPLRDKVFHYDAKAAHGWGKQKMENEKDEKPPYYKISVETLELSLGTEYDEYLFGKYLFVGVNGITSLMDVQRQIYEIHRLFVTFLQFIVEYIMKRSNIPKNREFGWFSKYRYGFRKDNIE